MGTWVFGDIHGCYDEFMALKSKVEEEDKTAKIIIIGDIIDRGPKTREMLEWAIGNVTDTGKYQMICGNHEMNVIKQYDEACRLAIRLGSGMLGYVDRFMKNNYDFQLLFKNQPLSTLEEYICFMRKLPLFKEINVDGRVYIIAHAWYDISRDEKTILEFRDTDEFSMNLVKYRPVKGETLVHGHTATIMRDCYQHGIEPGKVWDKGTSINIDCGIGYKISKPESKTASRGNLAAIRLEDKKIRYVYE